MRILRKGILLLISAVILYSIGLFYMQKKLIFLPTKLAADHVYQFPQPYEELFLDTEDGARLNAVHFKTKDPKGIILYFHGNAGDLSRWGLIGARFTKYNYDVLIMDYRTYGKSTGKISEENLIKDAQLFYDHVLKEYKEEDVVLYGRSLGTNFAAYVAAKNNPGKLILETPFYDLEEAAKNRIPLLPVKYFLKFQFPSNVYISEVKCPIFIFHGTKDKVVPYRSGKRLSKIVSNEQLTFVTIPEGEHNNLIEFEEYRNAIETVLK